MRSSAANSTQHGESSAANSTRQAQYDLIVVGSGIAGLFTAVKAAEHGRVALVTKASLEESNTRYAQGGIAAVMFPDDNVELHVADTLVAGAGLCDEDAVRVLCGEGPDRIRELLSLGVEFDTTDGNFARGLEAAHSRARVLHAGGDATGARVESALANALRTRNVDVYEHAFLSELIVENNRVSGVQLLGGVSLYSSAVVLASGGAGQLYAHTTNPLVATGDGTAAAFRAGAVISDSEFYQFHPTSLAVGDAFLISEAVRGEGATLRNASGAAFMTQYDPRGDLASRDVVARAIANEMHRQDGWAVVLDATAMSAEFLASRFPTINAHLNALGIDWATTAVPVTPAAHYWMGGVRTDTWGRTSVSGLYAVGETACTGIHGANRLASNSLLEGIVFGGRVVRHLVAPEVADGSIEFPDEVSRIPAPSSEQVVATKADVQQLMWDKVGLVRDGAELEVALKQLGAWTGDDHETRNLITVGRVLAQAALSRTESRGAQFRTDFPEPSPAWEKHLGFTC